MNGTSIEGRPSLDVNGIWGIFGEVSKDRSDFPIYCFKGICIPVKLGEVYQKYSFNEHFGLFNFYKGIETIPYFELACFCLFYPVFLRNIQRVGI